jgi:hypothetical protein
LNSDASDPFRDPEDSLLPQTNDFRFENEFDDARLVRGQLTSYDVAHTGNQFRVHILEAESSQGSFVGIAMVRLLPGA